MIANSPSQSEDIDGGSRIESSLLDDFKHKEDVISMQEKNTFSLNKLISAHYNTVIGYIRRLATSSMLLWVRGSLRKPVMASKATPDAAESFRAVPWGALAGARR